MTATLSKSRTIAVFINQLREKIGISYGSPEVTPGGRALKFYSSVRLDIRRRSRWASSKKSGAWYTYDGEQLGQGRENAKSFLAANPAVMSALNDRFAPTWVSAPLPSRWTPPRTWRSRRTGDKVLPRRPVNLRPRASDPARNG
ncbi:MAG: hypothetical protein ACRDWV_06245 [Acidimicrobiales bacterium]